MKNEKGFTLVELLMVVVLGCVVGIAGTFGWGMNVYKLTKCDFEAPYKAEIIRSAGVIAVPAGMIVGYMDIDDSKK